jgi:hypothetical protein
MTFVQSLRTTILASIEQAGDTTAAKACEDRITARTSAMPPPTVFCVCDTGVGAVEKKWREF